MSTLRQAAEQYLQLRRDLGYKLRETGRRLRPQADDPLVPPHLLRDAEVDGCAQRHRPFDS